MRPLPDQRADPPGADPVGPGGLRGPLLGSVGLVVAGRARTVPGLRRKAVLAALGLHPGVTVSVDRLTDVVWGDKPPATALNTLQSHISYLRNASGPAVPILARP